MKIGIFHRAVILGINLIRGVGKTAINRYGMDVIASTMVFRFAS